MRVLVISDIHANLTALEAVLQDAGAYDAVWCLGDIVGYGPDPNQCIERVGGLPNLICLIGNHDAAALGQIDLESFNHEARLSAYWSRSVLTEENLQFLRGLHDKVIVDQVTLTHGSPRNPVWEYLLDSYSAAVNFTYFDTQLCFVGHTHLPIIYFAPNGKAHIEWQIVQELQPIQLRHRAILNPGSVGQPRDHDPRASYAIFYPGENVWEPHRVEYDIESVKERIYQAGLPHRHGLRLVDGW